MRFLVGAVLGLSLLQIMVVTAAIQAAREWLPANEIIAFSASGRATQDIFLQDVCRGLVRNLTGFTGSHHETQPAWSPDGMQLVFASAPDPFAPTDLYVIGMDGRGLRQLTDTVESEFNPAWSTDGDQLAFMRFGGNVATIYRMDVNGDNTRMLPQNENFHLNPVWSPDGKLVASYSNPGDDPGISIMEADGSNEWQLVRTGGPGGAFAWSPDGSQIAFITDDHAIGLADIQSGRVQQLELPGYQVAVNWLADGNRLVYLSVSCNYCDPQIYMVDMGSGEEHLFTGGTYGGTLPAWRPS
jgi:Tol biopolymer transport system component